jgi:hypothetical protein
LDQMGSYAAVTCWLAQLDPDGAPQATVTVEALLFIPARWKDNLRFSAVELVIRSER